MGWNRILLLGDHERTMRQRLTTMLAVTAMAVLAADLLGGPARADDREEYADVLALKPVGFWPLDEGGGTALRNLEDPANDAYLFNGTWVDGNVEVTGGYEFIDIPKSGAYEAGELSLGGWVFERRPRPGPNSNARGVNVFGNWCHNKNSILLQLTGEDKLSVEIVSSGKEDVLSGGSLETAAVAIRRVDTRHQDWRAQHDERGEG